MRETQTIRSDRDRRLKRLLEDQRAQVLSAIRFAIRAEREDAPLEGHEVRDEAEESEADVQSELGFALLQMQGETLDHIAEALERLDVGRYGFCLDCGAAIPARRLEAVPFATRCTDCEQDREAEGAHHLAASAWRRPVKLFDAAD
jgi:RNA polymerase-binding transcription factor